MKKLTIAALLAGQLLAAVPPAFAAELTGDRTQQTGAFGGLRLRVPLDGHAPQRPVRAGLTLAPTLHSRTMTGESRLRIGEGLELGIVGREPPRLSIGGQDVRRLGAAQQDEDDDERRGPSTVAWVAIGVAALVVVTATVGYFWLEDRVDDD